MQVAGTKQPMGVVAVLPFLEGLRGHSLICIAGRLSLLSALAIKRLQRVAKVLIEFCSDFIVAQEPPAGGRGLLLVPNSSGLW